MAPYNGMYLFGAAKANSILESRPIDENPLIAKRDCSSLRNGNSH